MICEFSVAPIGDGVSLSKDVAKIIDLIHNSGIRYQTHAMGTLVEGEWDEIFALIKKCHNLLRADHSRVLTRIVIDDKQDATDRITGKIDSVEKQLGYKINV
jgi:uncharacterized protein (TIGR00106 family)